jgi:hypothetical protein
MKASIQELNLINPWYESSGRQVANHTSTPFKGGSYNATRGFCPLLQTLIDIALY